MACKCLRKIEWLEPNVTLREGLRPEKVVPNKKINIIIKLRDPSLHSVCEI